MVGWLAGWLVGGLAGGKGNPWKMSPNARYGDEGEFNPCGGEVDRYARYLVGAKNETDMISTMTNWIVGVQHRRGLRSTSPQGSNNLCF
jgi:hypothetical protein